MATFREVAKCNKLNAILCGLIIASFLMILALMVLNQTLSFIEFGITLSDKNKESTCKFDAAYMMGLEFDQLKLYYEEKEKACSDEPETYELLKSTMLEKLTHNLEENNKDNTRYDFGEIESPYLEAAAE